MNTSNTLFVGVKGHVAAFSKNDGSLIWKTKLKCGAFSGDRFVTLIVDGQRIYAHSHGQLFCLDAASGQQLWSNGLEGLSYDIASLATDCATTFSQATLARYKRSKESDGNGGGDAGN